MLFFEHIHTQSLHGERSDDIYSACTYDIYEFKQLIYSNGELVSRSAAVCEGVSASECVCESGKNRYNNYFIYYHWCNLGIDQGLDIHTYNIYILSKDLICFHCRRLLYAWACVRPFIQLNYIYIGSLQIEQMSNNNNARVWWVCCVLHVSTALDCVTVFLFSFFFRQIEWRSFHIVWNLSSLKITQFNIRLIEFDAEICWMRGWNYIWISIQWHLFEEEQLSGRSNERNDFKKNRK